MAYSVVLVVPSVVVGMTVQRLRVLGAKMERTAWISLAEYLVA